MHVRFRLLALALLVGCGSSGNEPGTGAPDDPEVGGPPVTPGQAPATPPTQTTPPDNTQPTPEPVDPNAITIHDEDYEKWQWLPIEGNECGDGSPAGVGINFTKESSELVVWFQGNGICYDGVSCTMFANMLGGMGPDPITHLFWENPDSALHGPFNRQDGRNPWRKANFVVFPHCALDGHAGENETEYVGVNHLVHQHGYTNVTRALKRIVPTFKHASRITVAGFSAGGIGTVANYHQIASAFEAVGQPAPFMVNDAGPVMQAPYLNMNGQKGLRKGWGLDATFISFCPECIDGGIHLVHEAMWKTHKGMRSALISTYSDGVAGMLYRLIDRSPNIFNTFGEGLKNFEKWAASKQGEIGSSKHRSFFRPGSAHGQIYPDFSANPPLADFIQNMYDDSPNWKSDVP